MAEPFESRLPAFDPRRTNGVLSDAMRAGQAALGAAQDWLGERVPQIPEIPEEYYEAAQ